MEKEIREGLPKKGPQLGPPFLLFQSVPSLLFGKAIRIRINAKTMSLFRLSIFNLLLLVTFAGLAMAAGLVRQQRRNAQATLVALAADAEIKQAYLNYLGIFRKIQPDYRQRLEHLQNQLQPDPDYWRELQHKYDRQLSIDPDRLIVQQLPNVNRPVDVFSNSRFGISVPQVEKANQLYLCFALLNRSPNAVPIQPTNLPQADLVSVMGQAIGFQIPLEPGEHIINLDIRRIEPGPADNPWLSISRHAEILLQLKPRLGLNNDRSFGITSSTMVRDHADPLPLPQPKVLISFDCQTGQPTTGSSPRYYLWLDAKDNGLEPFPLQ